MRVRLANVLWTTLTVALAGCANYSTLQEAETMPARKLKIGVGAAFNRYPVEFESTATETLADGSQVTTTTSEHESFTVPTVAAWARYGLSDRLELHGMAWLPLGLSVGGKYMLIGDRTQHGFILSPGLDVTMPVTISLGDNDESYTLMDVMIPLHGGYRVNDAFEIYVTPKYLMRMLNFSPSHSAGGTLGLALGRHTQVLLEGGVFYDINAEMPILNGGLGFSFD